ncbi:MAG TPA: helix-turn-helix domain-containing protein [Actinomycetota bacterium]|nr:helix-turn-helix domain-containing protein [Actinomycetota bacterium]
MAGELEDIGTRLREQRDRVGISQRELARRIGLSASMISQIESGQSKPSVSTLYDIVNELGVSVDDIFSGGNGSSAEPGSQDGAAPGSTTHHGPMVRLEDRHVIDLDSGVRWERLTSHKHEDVDFLHVVYDVGGSSASDTKMMRHPGREYGLVLEGRLGVQLGFDDFALGPGDSIAFDSTQPHRLWNLGDVPVSGIWFVVGRDG